jgi:hypothetical protein
MRSFFNFLLFSSLIFNINICRAHENQLSSNKIYPGSGSSYIAFTVNDEEEEEIIVIERDETTGHSETDTDPDWVYQNKALFFGGEKADGTFSNELWIFTPPFILEKVNVEGGPEARKDHAAFFSQKEEKLFIIGGVNKNGDCLTDKWYFDFSEHKWVKECDNCVPCVSKSTSKVIGDKAYIHGGVDGNGQTKSTLYSVDLTDVFGFSELKPQTNSIEPAHVPPVLKKITN